MDFIPHMYLYLTPLPILSVSHVCPQSYLKLTISLESKKLFLNVLSSLLLIEV